ncbi:MAG: putative toxin-antitoxin system toxin component, PIN family [Oscillospiraceae bacterium]|nr:putative toxin-antitoxin system toxin component, PIN family [Oscillospiraceae bacterium]
MRIMIDSNVLVSAFVLTSPHMLRMIDVISKHHTIILSTYIIDELKRVTKEKFPTKYNTMESFLQELPFHLVYTPDVIKKDEYPDIRDIKDLPILVSAIIEDVDILISGDSDFAPIDLEYPEILTPREFVEKYG